MAIKLSVREKAFLKLVKKASLTNPFTDELVETECQISKLSKNAKRVERIETARYEIEKIVVKLEQEKRSNFTLYEDEEDQVLVKYALLFQAFTLFRKKFDALIYKQFRDNTNLTVDFADEAIGLLEKQGFIKIDAVKYFALFFQMRRAFFFIYKELIGSSNVMKKLRRNLWDSVFTYDIELYEKYLLNKMQDFSTLMLGERGTGKSLAARIVGSSSFIPFDIKTKKFQANFNELFIALSLSEFSTQDIEKEIFGYENKKEKYEGVLQKCSQYGAIFLDEIERLPFSVQMKIVSLLQDRLFLPVGSRKKEHFKGRIIASTENSLFTDKKNTIFRDEFLSRLSSDIITIPPLRERIKEEPKELDELLISILSKLGVEYNKELTKSLKKKIKEQLGQFYLWNGNVKELEQCVHRILLKGEYKGDNFENSYGEMEKFCSAIKKENLTAKELLSRYCKILYQSHKTIEEVSKITQLDRRTVKKNLSL